MIKKVGWGILLLLVALIALLVFRKAPIDPVSYNPPQRPEMAGILIPNNLLDKAELLAVGRIHGPEDVDVDNQGRVYGGTQDGRIVRLLPGGVIETFAETHGRPLGLHFDKRQNLIVCDAYRGLLSINRDGYITTLATSAEGVSFKFTDDLDIANDGMIYFSDASDTFFQKEYLYDLLEARPHGRLMSYDPATGRVKVLLKGLFFANGVALSENEDFVLVNETYRYRIRRYWLKGVKAGTNDIFIDNLPGFPDGVSANRKGTFWIALFTVRNDILDRLHPSPLVKTLMSKLPHFLWPKPLPYGCVLALDEDGNIIKSFQEPTGKHLREITSVQEHEGYLYLGSLNSDRIGKYKLP